jgi:S-phase kinase-associated protein 1
MAAEAETKAMITLRSCEGQVFEVAEAVAMESQTIRHMIEDKCADTGIPLPNVSAKILSKVIEYCSKHVEARGGAAAAADGAAPPPAAVEANKAVEDELKTFDAEFVKVDQSTLFDLILVRTCLPPRALPPFVFLLLMFHLHELCDDCLIVRLLWLCASVDSRLEVLALCDDC